MKVILLRDIVKLGRKGEIKEVSDGYANNYLLQLGYAKLATPKLQEQVIRDNQMQTAKLAKEQEQLKSLQSELEKRTFTIKVKVGAKGQIFGGVKDKDIAQAINAKLKSTIEKNQIEAAHGIKALGEHTITIKLGHGLVAKTKLTIEPLWNAPKFLSA